MQPTSRAARRAAPATGSATTSAARSARPRARARPPRTLAWRHGVTGPAYGAFGEDAFGRGAEKVARFFGTPQYIVGQSIVVAAWIAVNAVGLSLQWDPYPFILLNLAFSTQAAYAAPLILLAQTRQAERDKDHALLVERTQDHMERMDQQRVAAIKRETDRLTSLLESNTELTRQDKELTEQVADLTKQIHDLLTAR